MARRIRRPAPSGVVGLDLSLTGTGVVGPTGEMSTITSKYAPKKDRPLTPTEEMLRLEDLEHQILGAVGRPELVVVEGYSFASKFSHAHALGELGGRIRRGLFRRGIPYQDVPPNSLKSFATGKGNAKKEAVGYAAVARFGVTPDDNNQADALWLREIGLRILGIPTIDLPKTHLQALEKLPAQVCAIRDEVA